MMGDMLVFHFNRAGTRMKPSFLAERAGLAESETPTARKPAPDIAFGHIDRIYKELVWEALWEGLWEEIQALARRLGSRADRGSAYMFRSMKAPNWIVIEYPGQAARAIPAPETTKNHWRRFGALPPFVRPATNEEVATVLGGLDHWRSSARDGA